MVPNGWKAGVIEDIAKVSSGGTPSRNEKSYWDGGNIPWVRTTEVQNCVLNYEDTQEFITRKGLEGSSAKLVPSGTLLMAMIGQGKTRGQVALLNFEATTNQNCATILLKKNNSSEFYFNYLLSKYERIRNWSNSAGQSNLSGALVKSIPVMIPPFQEQQKIANILSTWDKAISTTERLIENSTQQKKALMQQLLTGKKRLLDELGQRFEGEWEEVELGEISHITTGSSNREDSSLTGEYAFFDRSIDVRTSGIFLFDAEAVIVGGEGQDFVPKYFEGKFDLHQRTYAIMHFKNAYGKFLFYYIGYYRHYFLSQAVGSTVKSLRLPMFQKMPIKLPSVKEQQKIATVLTNADKEIELLEQQLADLQQEKKALMQVLLTGKKRVLV